MSWLHCNKCGVIKTSRSLTKFFCGSCGHVLCGACNRLQICPVDKRPFKGVEINNSMPQKLRVYFEDPEKLLTPWQKCIRFQFEQRSRCEPLEFTRNIKQMRQLKEEIKLLGKAKEVLMESVEKNVKRNNKMKAYIKYCLQNRARPNRSVSLSRGSTSSTSFNNSSTHGESGVDLQFDELNISD